jgi:hypothetical protein
MQSEQQIDLFLPVESVALTISPSAPIPDQLSSSESTQRFAAGITTLEGAFSKLKADVAQGLLGDALVPAAYDVVRAAQDLEFEVHKTIDWEARARRRKTQVPDAFGDKSVEDILSELGL